MPKPTLAVSEIFGPTFQGEGPSLGRQAMFLRLSGCNLHCSWCDTPYTWDWTTRGGMYYKDEQTHVMLVQEVVERLIDARGEATLLVITGGEPMLQWRALKELLSNQGFWEVYERVEVETNGTVDPQDLGYDVHFNVSPKLSSSGNSFDQAWLHDGYVTEDDDGAIFKFVCQDNFDLNEVAAICRSRGIADKRVWIMPEGRSAQTILETSHDLAQEVLERGWNLTTRQHVLLWNDERGR